MIFSKWLYWMFNFLCSLWFGLFKLFNSLNSNVGLFPDPKEISYECSCPDWAGMCKHVAATLYGIGSRLDQKPELLFRLRGVDPQELVSMQMNLETTSKANLLESDNLAELFDIQIDQPIQAAKTSKTLTKVKQSKKQKSTLKTGKGKLNIHNASRNKSSLPGKA